MTQQRRESESRREAERGSHDDKDTHEEYEGVQTEGAEGGNGVRGVLRAAEGGELSPAVD